jgi:hypothetical protein
MYTKEKVKQLMLDASHFALTYKGQIDDETMEEWLIAKDEVTHISMKRIIAVSPDFSIFVYHYNDLCLAICKSRLEKGEIAAYHAVEITTDDIKQPTKQ